MDSLAPIALFRSSFPATQLYQTPKGHPVFLDLQGAWVAEILGDPIGSLWGVADDRPWKDRKKSFADFAYAGAERLGADWGWVAHSTEFGVGPSSAHWGSAQQAMSQEGSGWILAESCEIEINKSGRVLSLPSWAGQVAVPFWNGFRSSRHLPMLTTGVELSLAADISIDDKGSLASSGVRIERASSVERSTWLDGTGSERCGAFLSLLGQASFEVELPAGTRALGIRRTFDSFHGLQRARILVDGRRAGCWHQTLQDRENRWATDDCLVKVPAPSQRQRSVVVLEPPAGSPLFSIGRMEVWALTW